jgi:predicted O-linked N-acetylglucosamine transferase (SPINDLY family)
MRPAPVQVSGWGYSGGTGLSAIGHLVADAVTVPPEREHQYDARIMRLPCLFSYHPGESYPDIVEAPEARNGYRTYGYMGRAMKLNGPTLAAWAKILRADPTGRLLIKGAGYDVRAIRDRIAHALLAMGVSMDRVEVRGTTTRQEHLAAYQEIDVALDPFPQNGGMTVMDACLMGVPTVTLLGEAIQGRQTASVLEMLGIGQWVAGDIEDYIEAAVGNASPRRGIREALLASIITHPTAYARATEAAYWQAFAAWCENR